MRRICIIDPEDMVISEAEVLDRMGIQWEYKPNFTIPQNDKKETIASGITTAKSSASAGINWKKVALAMAPISTLPLALQVAASIARPAIAQYLEQDQKETSTETRNSEAEEFARFLEKYAITLKIAKLAKFKFPPGHPQVGQTYILHPLAELPGSRKENVYIPHEVYDDLLLAEREAELLKLLVDLGATKVSITKKQSNQTISQVTAGVSGGSKLVGDVGIQANLKSEENTSNLDCRTFELTGKAWHKGDILDRSKFAWVAYEPSWEALVVAREIGGCLKAAIEIKDDASFASDREIRASLKTKGISGNASGKLNHDLSEERSYLVKAEFLPLRSPESPS